MEETREYVLCYQNTDFKEIKDLTKSMNIFCILLVTTLYGAILKSELPREMFCAIFIIPLCWMQKIFMDFVGSLISVNSVLRVEITNDITISRWILNYFFENCTKKACFTLKVYYSEATKTPKSGSICFYPSWNTTNPINQSAQKTRQDASSHRNKIRRDR